MPGPQSKRPPRHSKAYITDKKKRSNQKSKRKQTLIHVNKCHELSQLTGVSAFFKMVCHESNKSYVYATDDLYFEYATNGLCKPGTGSVKESREFGELSVDFNKNHPILLSPVKVSQVPKCVLPGDLANITVYYDAADSFAKVDCIDNVPDIIDIAATITSDPDEPKKPPSLHQECATKKHPNLSPTEIPVTQPTCDMSLNHQECATTEHLNLPPSEIPVTQSTCEPSHTHQECATTEHLNPPPAEISLTQSTLDLSKESPPKEHPVGIQPTPLRTKRQRKMTLKAMDYHFNHNRGQSRLW